jgi:hypothetical protein
MGSFGIVSDAPVTGPNIGVNDRRWQNLKRCGGFHSAAESTESGRGDRTRIVRAVEDNAAAPVVTAIRESLRCWWVAELVMMSSSASAMIFSSGGCDWQHNTAFWEFRLGA